MRRGADIRSSFSAPSGVATSLVFKVYNRSHYETAVRFRPWPKFINEMNLFTETIGQISPAALTRFGYQPDAEFGEADPRQVERVRMRPAAVEDLADRHRHLNRYARTTVTLRTMTTVEA